ncbi:hypothetical protein L226DRAFT_539762 [Lentinus tigrinus ALCF2SS1-7]|uniref:Homeobox domain-containing protein n=1 Tax=Lentinus tigrinus ALCF2SS1-6 TaxID=1328759 RepID=A0A5C2SAK6_9APHY|nr:hypothetical protein L227DRAFT_575393 [Lentinus tigrinus ALCF2SS1-6]RPD69577.1 hypothetical protein L226DRAFT_539762 [Lentinus tigrinus ALCF2SS1-7]
MARPTSNTSEGAYESRPRAARIHLPQEAYDILNDYFYKVSEWPDEPTRIALAERVRQISGCGHYTAVHVYRYFGNMRFKTGSTSVNPAPRKVRTTIKEGVDSVENKLDVLLRENPNPSRRVAEIWAEKLGDGATPEYILTYAFLWASRIASSSSSSGTTEESDHGPQPAQLPTPDPSQSPELRSPVSPPAPQAIPQAAQPPMQPIFYETQALDLSHAPLGNSDVEPKTVLPHDSGTPSVSREDEVEAELREGLEHALGRGTSSSEDIPKTFSALAAWTQDMTGSFADDIAHGKYAVLGLTLPP